MYLIDSIITLKNIYYYLTAIIRDNQQAVQLRYWSFIF